MTKSFTPNQDTIQLEKVAISNVNFKVVDSLEQLIPPNQYHFNPQKAQLYFYNPDQKKITVSYFNYPTFLTKSYSPFDKSLILKEATPSANPFSLKKSYDKTDFFGDLNTYGNLTRGITVGNNQGSVLNSGLDLQITGNLSEKLKIRASIKDTNIPIQENGISQRINEFDRVFIELFTDQWKIKAGDVDLTNQESYFMAFTKKINGAKLEIDLDHDDQETSITASGALVKGKFNSQNISTIEGNQGPYQLYGVNGELNIVVISGSETVYVNGMALKRGEQHDYTIDYNNAQIVFTPTFPINSSQRIVVDFQYSDQNYNRFVTHNGMSYQNKKVTLGAYFYNENDVKAQHLQQNLNDNQKIILQEAGNDSSKMIANSAVSSSYDENRIQYEKTTSNGKTTYTHSTSENATLYNVSFSYTGVKNGDYVIDQVSATGTIYKYVGANLGDYAPITLLIAPTKLQMTAVNANYQINEDSFVSTEVAYSNNDQNLFSSKDDSSNHGIATTLTWQQKISHSSWNIDNLMDIDVIQKNFNNIEGLYNPEFNRDWNLDFNLNPSSISNQTYIRNKLSAVKDKIHMININTDYLRIGTVFHGHKTSLNTHNTFGNIILNTKTSYLKNSNNAEEGYFARNLTSVKYQLKKAWVSTSLKYEDNQQENSQSKMLNLTNQKLIQTGVSMGVGDTTKVYSKFSFNRMQIDSVRNNQSVRVQQANNFTLKSKLIMNKKTSLSTFMNYRKVNHIYSKDLNVFNGQIQYTQRFFKNIVHWATVFETSSGSTNQQNFTYIEVEAGQGYYTYLGDLNNNKIKDFDEFEVAQFTDQANYLRVVLPNLSQMATQKAKFSQSVFVNFISLKNRDSKWQRMLSHLSNQSSILIHKDQLKEGVTFNIDPFDTSNPNVVGLQQNVRSSLFFNRGLQHYSTTYTYQSNKNTQNIGHDFQTSSQQFYELNFQHHLLHSWILNTTLHSENNSNTSDNFSSRNFDILSKEINPSIRFIKDEFSNLEAEYSYRKEKNVIGLEDLISHDFGIAYNYNHSKKGSIITTLNIVENKYSGPLNTPASYRILEGLQPDRNFTWSLIIQKKITSLLDLNISYNGRKNNLSQTIHTGNVQLRANF